MCSYKDPVNLFPPYGELAFFTCIYGLRQDTRNCYLYVSQAFLIFGTGFSPRRFWVETDGPAAFCRPVEGIWRRDCVDNTSTFLFFLITELAFFLEFVHSNDLVL